MPHILILSQLSVPYQWKDEEEWVYQEVIDLMAAEQWEKKRLLIPVRLDETILGRLCTFSDHGPQLALTKPTERLGLFRQQGEQPMSEKSVHPRNSDTGERACQWTSPLPCPTTCLA